MTHLKVGRVLIILVGLLSITCSDDEVATRSYPAIETKAVTEINQGGANLNAEILNTGNSGISDHGFVYDDVPSPTLDKSDRISLGETTQKGTFSALVNRNLIKDKKYYVKAYSIAKNNNFIVYGQEVEFISLGGSTPEIEDFVPKQGVIGDTVMLIGTGFSNVLSNNIIHFGQNASTVVKVDDSKLWCIVPTSTITGENELSITLGGNKIKASSKFLLQELIIKSIDQEWVTFRDVLTLNVDNLPKLSSLIDVNILGKKAEIINHSESELKVKVSDEVTANEQPVVIKVGSQTKESQLTIKLKLPVINSFEPVEGKRGEIITIYGDNFHPILSKHQIKFGSYLVEILTASRNYLTVKLPGGLVDQMVNIEVNVSGQTINSTEQFHLLSPWRKVSSLPGQATAEASAWAACGYGYVTFGESWKYDPIDNVWEQIASYPSSSLFELVSFSAGCNGYVGAGGSIYGGSFDKFYEYSSESDTWNVKSYFPQGNIKYNAVGWTLNGYGYVTLGTQGYLNTPKRETLRFSHETNSWIYVKAYPGELPPNYWTIYSTGYSMDNIGYALIFNLSQIKNYFWKYNPSLDEWFQLPSFPGNAKSSTNSFGLNSVGYVIGGSKNASGNETSAILKEVWKFDESLNNWIQLEDFPGEPRQSAVTFTIENKAYYGTGFGKNGQLLKDFWEFDPTKL